MLARKATHSHYPKSRHARRKNAEMKRKGGSNKNTFLTCWVWISLLQRHHGGFTLGGGGDLRTRRWRSHDLLLRRRHKLLFSLVLVHLVLTTLKAAESTITPTN